MIKILSFKTRRPDLSFDAFRAHYEGRHVPLGLSLVEHFRWRRYVRNYVVDCVRGSVSFDCLTEFWIADRSDQEATAAFVASPEFERLDRDDRSFLDVASRLSFEVDEQTLGGSPTPPGSRVSMFVGRPAEKTPAAFASAMRAQAADFVRRAGGALEGAALDLRADGDADGPCAILSVWAPDVDVVRDLDWASVAASAPIALLESVETPAARLYPGGERR